MGNSLQEQLLKAGLVTEQRLKETRSDKRKAPKPGSKRGAGPDAEARRAADRALAEKAARDRELNRQRQEESERRARENELRQLIHTHRVVREGGDVPYNFTDGRTLKRLYVSRDHRARLVDGRLAVVRQDSFYELIPAEIAERVQGRDPARILVWNRPTPAAQGEDPYAEFQVPDDLMW